MERIVPSITDEIADTLFINIAAKCREHRKSGGFYNDPTACRIMESVDYDFSRFDKGMGASVAVAVRAKYFDDMTAEFVRSRAEPVVVFVGCGLDPRYHRLDRDVADKAVFYELDLPEVICLREQLLPPEGNEVLVPGSMLETDWMDDLKKAHPNADFMFTMEGVCIYFDNEAVKGVMSNLARRFAGGQVLFDATSSWLCRNQHRISKTNITMAPFKLKLDDEHEVEQWSNDLHLESCRFYSDFRETRQAGFLQSFMIRMIPVLRNSSRIICCSFG